MKPVRVAVAAMRSVVGDVEGNLGRALRLLDEAAGEKADLLVLPEACLTGYDAARAALIAIEQTDEACAALEAHAAQQGVALCYGLIERNPGGAPFVTQVTTDGTARLVYRKTHLGRTERGVFSAGDELPVAQVAGAAVGVHLCWEAHLPQIAGTLRAKDAELLLIPLASGCSGERRLDTWRRFLPARAYDNGAFVVAVNAVRERGDGSLCGGGVMVCAPGGAVLVEEHGFDERLVACDLDGALPRDREPDGMRGTSWFDHRRPELYQL